MPQQPSVFEQAAAQVSLWASLLPLILAGTSALFGLLAGWLGAYLKVKGENLATKEDFREALQRLEENTRVIEGIKASIVRRSSLDSELREAVRQFTVAAGGLLHSMCWLTWDCTARNRVDADMVSRYDIEAHALLPQIVAQLAVIAMLDREIYNRLLPLANEIFSLDIKIGNAVVNAEKNREHGLEQLRMCHAEGNQLEQRFRDQTADLFHENAVDPV